MFVYSAIVYNNIEVGAHGKKKKEPRACVAPTRLIKLSSILFFRMGKKKNTQQTIARAYLHSEHVSKLVSQKEKDLC